MNGNVGLAFAAVPLWIPFLLAGIPTTLLWYRDRRPLPGICHKCGYDLTGNISGVCPECGQVIPTPSANPAQVTRSRSRRSAER